MKLLSPRSLSLLYASVIGAGALLPASAAVVKIEAETGVRGSAMSQTTAGPVTYISPTTTAGGSNPGSAARITTYTVTFPTAGRYDLYVRMFVTTDGGAPNNDSMFVPTSFGTKSPSTNGDWVTLNSMDVVGSAQASDIVGGSGAAVAGVWKWLNVSKFGSGTSYNVPEGALTQTFQIGAREDGLYLDAMVFGSTALIYTVANLDAGADGSPPPPLSVTLDYNNRNQQLDGFGGAIAYDTITFLNHPKKTEMVNLLFRDLGLDILRVRNTYGWSENDAAMLASAEIVGISRQFNPAMKTFLVPWSPPAYLKSNNDVNNGGTLKGGPGAYIYGDYAQWWADSIRGWRALGVDPDYVTIQNEPDQTVTYDSFRLAPTETATMAGYDKAFKAVVEKFEADFGDTMPEMWAPEHSGMGGGRAFVTALNNAGLMSKLQGIATHPYGEGNYDTPDAASFNNAQTSYYTDYTLGLGKSIHMTEYVRLNSTPGFDQGFRFAWHLHNFLYKARVTTFFNWTLFRGLSPESGGIVTMVSANDYVIRPQYWFLKAYTRFTNADWWVLGTTVAGTSAETLKAAAFRSPKNDELTVVLLNTSTGSSIEVGSLNITNFTPVVTEVFRSSETEQWASLPPALAGLTLPRTSVTTIHLMSGQAAVAHQTLVTRGGFAFNRRTGKMVQQITVKNTSTVPVLGPIYVALDALSANTSLTNQTGVTSTEAPLGSSYLLVSNATLPPGASVTASLEFSPPTSGGITYQPRVIAQASP